MSAPDRPDAQERGLRLVYITAAYLPWVGGIEILISQLVPLLRERGHEVVIVTSHGSESPPGFDDVDGVRVLRVPAHHAVAQRNPAKILDIQRQMVEFARDFQPDPAPSRSR